MVSVKGVAPGFLLLPAREYTYELKEKITIELPAAGRLSEILNKEELAEGVNIGLDDDFALFEDGVFYLWQVIGVLFAQTKYPQLKDDEMVNVVALERVGDNIILHGEILKCV